MKARKTYIVLIVVAVLAIICIIAGGAVWTKLGSDAVVNERTVLVPTGADYAELLDSLGSDGAYIADKKRFEKVAAIFSLPETVRPGHYVLRPGMSYMEVVKMFRNGLQSPVRLTFNNIRTLPQLAGRFAQQIEADSLYLLSRLTAEEVAGKYGFDSANFIGMFIPNTYEVWWTVSPDALLDRMKKEYDRFWNEERARKLEATGLTREQAVTLASIVYEETKMSDEMPVVAGVYMNRLKKGMPLQADPTIKFAIGDFSIKRVLNRHLNVDSPYNTYKNTGLPPGPICMPSVKAIDAVLDYGKHNYLYFCAKPDFSGYHSFAVTLARHNENARAYYKALNEAGIK